MLTLTSQSGLGRAHARHRGVRLPIPLPELDELTPQWVAERLMVAPGLPRGLHGHERRSALARLLANLVAAFVEYDMERVEIDPLLETRHGFVAGGVSIVLDERAAFRRPRALTGGGSPAPHPFWDVAAAPIIYTPLEGEVCVVTGGRALALLLQDALLDLGSPAACVVDVGCGCDRVRADAAMRLLLERTYHEGRCRSALVVLGPTVSSAPDVLQGLIGPLAGGGCAPLRTIVLLPGAAEGSPAVPPLPPELVLAPDLRTAIRWAARP